MLGWLALSGLGLSALSSIILRIQDRRLAAFRFVPATSPYELPWEKWRNELYRPDGHALLRQVRWLSWLMVLSLVLGLACLGASYLLRR